MNPGFLCASHARRNKKEPGNHNITKPETIQFFNQLDARHFFVFCALNLNLLWR